MALEFRTTDVVFDESKGKDQTERGTVLFGSKVRIAEAALKAFEINYTNGDHEILRETIGISNVKSEGAQVSFDVTIGLRDDSGNYDDPYEGKVTVLVTADLEAA